MTLARRARYVVEENLGEAEAGQLNQNGQPYNAQRTARCEGAVETLEGRPRSRGAPVL